MEALRLFVALPVPDRERELLERLGGELEGQIAAGRMTRGDNLHLTLHFLGNALALPAARRAVESVAFAPFGLWVDRLGRFRREGGDVLWAGVRPEPDLERLHRDLAAALAGEGFVPEPRPFRPHLTLARRVRLGRCDLGALEQAHLPVTLAVDRVWLMRSHLGPEGVRYTREGEARATPPGG